ncbi:MAG TPA: acyl-CoA dehydrogenase family protein [Candidatus Binatia bacterium]|jgi:alkylation response protein AidB-like acyl-CoA dehydrogenase|nr:acyl-CoA dehydrogenase family protein [Candidatus Binatia bacterium]
MIDAVRALAPALRDAAERTERDRRLAPELVAGLADTGVFRACVPRALGGGEVEPALLVRVLEEIARADGAAGWCAMIAATSGVVSGYLAEPVGREIYGRAVVTGGVFAPTGSAVVDRGSYRVTGRWRFASGCQHCDWLMAGAIVRDDGPPRARLVLFPAREAEIIDTWNVAGLRGTGSHDIALRDLLVPVERSVSLSDDRPVATGALYAFPVFGLLAIGIGAVALGIARRAVDELMALAGTKAPAGSRRTLAERGVVQSQVAEAEATVSSARAFLLDAVGEAWELATRDGVIPIATRARLRLAATHATTAGAAATDRMYTAGGGSAIYADNPLQRAFRDVHVATQHVMVAQPSLELVGRVLLGLDADTSML